MVFGIQFHTGTVAGVNGLGLRGDTGLTRRFGQEFCRKTPGLNCCAYCIVQIQNAYLHTFLQIVSDTSNIYLNLISGIAREPK